MIGRRKGSPSVDYDEAVGKVHDRAMETRFMRSKAMWVLSVGLLVTVAAAGVYVFLFTSPPTPRVGGEVKAAPTVQAAPPGPVTAAPAVTGCRPQPAADGAPEDLVRTTFQTQWSPTLGALYPSSESGGPSTPAWPAHCFARTPEGALYSAGSFNVAVGASVTPGDRISVVQARASRTGVYDQLMDQLHNQPSIAGAMGTTSQWRITGYRWLAYSPDAAKVELQLVRPGDGTKVGMAQELVWESDDWLVVVPPLNAQLYRTDLSQVVYTPWGPPA